MASAAERQPPMSAGSRASPLPLTGPKEVVRELNRLERRGELTRPPAGALPPGTRLEPIRLGPDAVRTLAAAAARRALGQDPVAGRISEVIWSSGGDELAVDPVKIDVKLLAGVVLMAIPVRCDQSGQAVVEIAVAVGAPDRPAGLFAAAEQRPRGPEVVVDRWADALVALAWGTVLELANSVAATVGRDDNGEVLIPGEIVASPDGLSIVPFARHPLGPLQS